MYKTLTECDRGSSRIYLLSLSLLSKFCQKKYKIIVMNHCTAVIECQHGYHTPPQMITGVQNEVQLNAVAADRTRPHTCKFERELAVR